MPFKERSPFRDVNPEEVGDGSESQDRVGSSEKKIRVDNMQGPRVCFAPKS